MSNIQYTITINQLAISMNGFEIDIIDAAIIDFVRHFISSEEMDIKDIGGERFYRLHSSYVSSQLPILGLKPEPITRRISSLIEKGYFKRVVEDGNTPWIRPTEKAKSIYGGSVSKDGGGPSQKTDNNSTSNNYTRITEHKENTELPTGVPATGRTSHNLEVVKTFPDGTLDHRNFDIQDCISSLQYACKNSALAYDSTQEREFARHIMTAKAFGEQAAIASKIAVEAFYSMERAKQSSCRIAYACNILTTAAKLCRAWDPIAGPKSVYQKHSQVYNEAILRKRKESADPRAPLILKN